MTETKIGPSPPHDGHLGSILQTFFFWTMGFLRVPGWKIVSKCPCSPVQTENFFGKLRLDSGQEANYRSRCNGRGFGRFLKMVGPFVGGFTRVADHPSRAACIRAAHSYLSFGRLSKEHKDLGFGNGQIRPNYVRKGRSSGGLWGFSK